MRVSLVGGIDRLERRYIAEAKKLGMDLRVFNRSEANLTSKIRGTEAVVLITGKVSHQARIQVMNAAKSNDIPVYQRHSCGICALRDCLGCLAGLRIG